MIQWQSGSMRRHSGAVRACGIRLRASPTPRLRRGGRRSCVNINSLFSTSVGCSVRTISTPSLPAESSQCGFPGWRSGPSGRLDHSTADRSCTGARPKPRPDCHGPPVPCALESFGRQPHLRDVSYRGPLGRLGMLLACRQGPRTSLSGPGCRGGRCRRGTGRGRRCTTGSRCGRPTAPGIGSSARCGPMPTPPGVWTGTPTPTPQ